MGTQRLYLSWHYTPHAPCNFNKKGIKNSLLSLQHLTQSLELAIMSRGKKKKVNLNLSRKENLLINPKGNSKEYFLSRWRKQHRLIPSNKQQLTLSAVAKLKIHFVFLLYVGFSSVRMSQITQLMCTELPSLPSVLGKSHHVPMRQHRTADGAPAIPSFHLGVLLFPHPSVLLFPHPSVWYYLCIYIFMHPRQTSLHKHFCFHVCRLCQHSRTHQ